MANISDIFGGAFIAPEIETVQDKYLQLGNAMADAGIEPPSQLFFDGELHRFSSGQGSKSNCWYVAHENEFMSSAVFGDWRENSAHNWRQNIGRTLSIVEDAEYKKSIIEAKRLRDESFAEKREQAAETALALYLRAKEANNDHPYLVSKGIKAHGALIHGDGRLVIPVFDGGDRTMTSIQFIGMDGSKQFLTGGAIKGGWHIIGSLVNAKHVFIAEGFATACSIYEATGKTCVVAFNAGNLPAVALSVRERVGLSCTITICADLDTNGIGEEKAKEAASLIGAKVVVSPTSSDFNDAAQAGVDIVSVLLPAVINNEFLIPLSEFCSKPAPIKWMIKNWVQRNSTCMVHGASGSGKTFLVVDWMCRIASQLKEWQGYKVNNGAVIYLAGEGHDGLRGRFEAWSRKYNGGNTGEIKIFVSKAGCDLNTPAGYMIARDAILQTGINPVCIVIDTLHRFLSGDENSAQDTKGMLDACAGLQQEFKTTVLFVHHTGVNEESQHRARGSSAWKGALDTEISVLQRADKSIEIIQRKSKDAEIVETEYLKLEPFWLDGWDDEDGQPYHSAVLVPGEKSIKLELVKITPAQKRFEILLLEKGTIVENEPFLSENDWLNSCEKDEKGHILGKSKTMRQRDKSEMIAAGLLFASGTGYYYPNDVIRSILIDKFK